MIRSSPRAPQSLLVLAIGVTLSLITGSAWAQAPLVTAIHPTNGEDRVPANVILTVVFDRPTGKQVRHSYVDITAGGGIVTTVPDRWSPLGDTLYIQALQMLPFGHFFQFKLNQVRDTTGVVWNESPTLYSQIYSFTTAFQAQVERIQAGNVNIGLTPDVTMPVGIPVRELAGTDVFFHSARVQFLPSELVNNTAPADLDLSVMPLYQYTAPLGIALPRTGTANLVAPVLLPGSVARDISQGKLGVRLTFYGVDETGSSVVVDAVFRVDSATVAAHQSSVLPAMASDVLVRAAVLEWPLHGMVIAAGDTILPRAVVTGNGTGPFRGAFYLDGEAIAMEEGYMEAGRPVTITMRGPLPLRRLGEHRLQFAVESPQPVAANPISIICAPPANGVAPRERSLFAKPAEAPTTPHRLHGGVTWLTEGRTQFREEDHSAVGWGGWNGAYDLGHTRKIEAQASARLRFDDVGNGSGQPQHVLVRYTDPRHTLAYGDAPPERAQETPLFMSPVPRRSAQAGWTGTPLGDVEGYVALSSRPMSVAGQAPQVSDLYAGKLRRSLWKQRVQATLYGGYTHEDADTTSLFSSPTARFVQRKLIYGGLATVDLPGTWTLLGDIATVHHRAPDGAPVPGTESRSRTGWRSEVRGTAKGFAAVAQAFSYQPALVTALNPYALEDRRGGFAQLTRGFLKYHFTGSFRSEEPTHVEGQEPTVRVQTGTFSTRVEMNEDSWVTPYYVRVRHRGANTDFTEQRIGGDYSVSEAMGGRTTARFDVTFLNDLLRVATRRRVTSGSVVSTRKHPGNVVSTLTVGFEQNKSQDLSRTDTTVQGSFEARWEAIPGRFLVIPAVSGVTRHYELFGTKEDRYSARLQLAFLRVPGFGENAVSLEGRVDRVQHLEPARARDLDGSVQLTIGQRFSIAGL
jgi:hypothetical protein